MAEAIRTFLARACLCALAASLLALAWLECLDALLAIAGRVTVAWRGLSVAGRFAFLTLALALTIHGSTKTNSLPQLLSRPLRAMFPPAVPDAQRMIANWNARGAWDDSFRLDFEEGWELPWGDGHLHGVEIHSQGVIRPDWNATNAVAGIGASVAIVPGTTTFSAGKTARDSYLVQWVDAALNRDTNDLVTASIELCRNGNRIVTVDGVATNIARELPFAHDGYGQDAEWVAANFTNATEILAAGYPQWVDAQVGEGLTNGLYKFTVDVADDPPETVQLVVGDLSVAVTNAGEYAFLLEKGVEYEYGTIPFLANVAYAAVDDIPAPRLRLLAAQPDGAVRMWTRDGGYESREPTASELGRVAWWPLFYGSPDVSHIGPDDGPVTFEAVLSDCRSTNGVAFAWAAGDGLAASRPSAQTTEVRAGSMPSWAQATLSVTATVGGHALTSTLDGLSYGTNATPQVRLSLDVPDVLIVRGDWMPGSESALAHAKLECDTETNGVLRAWLGFGADKVAAALPASHGLYGERNAALSFAVDGVEQSGDAGDVGVCCAFVGEDGTTNATAFATTTVVSPKRVTVPSAPATGLCVLKGASVPVELEVEPGVAVETEWQTAKRRTKDGYGPWTRRGAGSPSATLAMTEAGVFALRAVTIGGGGCQSNAVEYVHTQSEPYMAALGDYQGLNKARMKNHIGVAGSQGLLDIRNAALSHLNHVEYGLSDWLLQRNGFSFVKNDRWKCNAFVADIAIAAGFTVPVLYIVPHDIMPEGRYPPSANDWAYGAKIDGWSYLGSSVSPEPGFIAGHPNPEGLGHCGIVDYDGWTISARNNGICRTAPSMLDGTCGYSKPNEDNNNEN